MNYNFIETRMNYLPQFNNDYPNWVNVYFTETRTEVNGNTDYNYPETVKTPSYVKTIYAQKLKDDVLITTIPALSDEKISEGRKHEVNPIFSIKNLQNVVEHPEHYGAGGTLQCIEAMLIAFGKQATMDFCKLNAFKYIWRAGLKGNEKQDMNKAKRYEEYWQVLRDLPGNEDDGSFHKYINS